MYLVVSVVRISHIFYLRLYIFFNVILKGYIFYVARITHTISMVRLTVRNPIPPLNAMTANPTLPQSYQLHPKMRFQLS